MKKQIVGVALVSAFVVLLAAQSEDVIEQAIVQLRQQVADLGLRVSNLEHAAGGSPHAVAQPDASGGTSAAATDAPVRRSMVVDGISQAQNRDDNSQEIDRLDREVSSLQNVVAKQQDNLAKAGGKAVHGQTSESGWKHTSDRRDIAADIDSKRDTLDLYATQLSIKQQRLDRLKAANSQPRQMIHGREGNVVITLESKFDLAEALQGINVGDTVTWSGTRTSVSQGAESWSIDSIEKVGG